GRGRHPAPRGPRPVGDRRRWLRGALGSKGPTMRFCTRRPSRSARASSHTRTSQRRVLLVAILWSLAAGRSAEASGWIDWFQGTTQTVLGQVGSAQSSVGWSLYQGWLALGREINGLEASFNDSEPIGSDGKPQQVTSNAAVSFNNDGSSVPDSQELRGVQL